MSDLNVNGALTRRRRATLIEGRAARVQAGNGDSATGTASLVDGDFSLHDGQRILECSLERSAAKSEKKKRGGEVGDRLR